jgi:hypothetical protein
MNYSTNDEDGCGVDSTMCACSAPINEHVLFIADELKEFYA